jgi:hypothetical protein
MEYPTKEFPSYPPESGTSSCQLPTLFIFPQHCYVKTQAKRETFLKENISSPSSPL